MLKLIFLCRRRPDISHERYRELVLEGHAPLALKHHPTLRRYVINIAEGPPEAGPEFDSLPALYFDTLADFQERLYDSPEGQRIISADVERFMAGADTYVTREQRHKWEMLAPPLHKRTPVFKLVSPLRRKPGLTHADFVSHWLRKHVPLVLEEQPALLAYVTNTVDARLSTTGEDWDGFAELYFAGEEDYRERTYASPEAAKRVHADRDRFIGASHLYAVGQYVQK